MSGEYAPEVVRDLHRMVADGLGQWGLPATARVTLLNLSENATFLLQADDVEMVLRVHRLGYSSTLEIRSELAWIEALRCEGVVETARPLPGRDGALVQELRSPTGGPARHAVAFERLTGREPSADEDAVPWFERLGAVTAKMHAHAKGWTPPAGFQRKRWDFDAMVGEQGHWGPWRAAAGLDPSGAALISEVLAMIRDRLRHFGMGPERFGLVHADLRLANLLVDGPHLRIIDFDDSGFSWFLYDFAAAVSFIEHQPVVPALLRAWVKGYRSEAALSAEDEAEIPSFVILRRILLCAWLASHAEIPFAKQFGARYTEATLGLAQALLQGRFLKE